MISLMLELLPGTLLAAGEEGAKSAVGSGRITGGWGYVWASYGLTWAMISGYALFLWMRRPGAKREQR